VRTGWLPVLDSKWAKVLPMDPEMRRMKLSIWNSRMMLDVVELKEDFK
jgi:hypothetical protein